MRVVEEEEEELDELLRRSWVIGGGGRGASRGWVHFLVASCRVAAVLFSILMGIRGRGHCGVGGL